MHRGLVMQTGHRSAQQRSDLLPQRPLLRRGDDQRAAAAEQVHFGSAVSDAAWAKDDALRLTLVNERGERV